MRLRHNQSGFSVAEILIVVVVLTLVGLIGYSFFAKQSDTNKPANNSTGQPAKVENVSVAPEVNSVSDLDKASTVLDEADTASSSDSAELDSQLQSF